MIGIPSGKYSPTSDFFNHLLHWVPSNFSPHDIYVEISNRVDVNRSKLIERAKQGNYDLLIMMDTDIFPITPFHDVIKMYEEDHRMYQCDVVIGELHQIGWGDETMISEITKLDSTRSYVYGGSAGFVIISRKVLQNLKPIDYFDEVTPLYAVNGVNATEDYVMFTNMRRQGFKVCVDKRFKLKHKKPAIVGEEVK